MAKFTNSHRKTNYMYMAVTKSSANATRLECSSA